MFASPLPWMVLAVLLELRRESIDCQHLAFSFNCHHAPPPYPSPNYCRCRAMNLRMPNASPTGIPVASPVTFAAVVATG